MKTKITFPVLFFTLTCMLFYSCTCDNDCPVPQEQISQYTLNKSIVRINTTNVATGFETVFSDLIPDSTNRAGFSQAFVDAARFYDDNSGYFFVETLDSFAWCVAHINHDLIGTSRSPAVDENGKYFIKEIVETVRYSGSGFVDYYKLNPATGTKERKLSFVTNIPSAQWFIGTGFYGNPPEKYYTPDEANRLILLEATRTMAKGISGIFKNIYTDEDAQIIFCRDFIDHIRFFDDGSGYFFINDFSGINIAHGADADHQGQNDYDLQDTRGAYIIRDMIDIAKNEGSGYYQYFWNNPSSGKEETKTVFVNRIPDTEYFIASGYYSK